MEDDDGADAMAAAMGFSSFGTQPSAKRRKFNSSSDSYVAGSSSAPGGDHGKGANALPLGTRPPPAQRPSQPAPPQQQQNANEISLDDDDDDFEPQYIDTSRPAAPAEAASAPAPGDAAVQATIDSIVGSAGLPGSGEHQVGGSGHGGHHRGGPRGDSRHRGGQPWYQDYYDPTANMNPWEKLEKQNGLEPLNNDWLSWEESKARWEKLQSDTSQQETATAAAA